VDLLDADIGPESSLILDITFGEADPEPIGSYDWNALAAEATARFEATGHWGM
jgi:hypothetical protein